MGGGSFLSSWPWRGLGSYKYFLYMPIVAAAMWVHYSPPTRTNVYMHILVLTAGRSLIYQAWQSFSRCLPLMERLQIQRYRISFAQVDREWHCDDYYLLQAILLCISYGGQTRHFEKLWDTRSLVITFLLHVGPAECFYYLCHRTFHKFEYLYQNYHKLHHASTTPEPSTVGSTTFLEHLVLATMVMGVPLIGGSVMANGSSIVALYMYVFIFDWLRAFGHSNVEVVPVSVYRTLPLLRYLLFTPSYHTLHHEHGNANFCLFMPLYDYLGRTVHPMTQDLHKRLQEDRAREIVPDFVFLLHGVGLMHIWHLPLYFRTFASNPYHETFLLFLIWPLTIVTALMYVTWGTTFKVWNYYIKGRFHQVWSVPRYGFMFFLPFQKDTINNFIEKAILDADRSGVKVFTLGALNKREALNGGGKMIVEKHPELKVRVCHGDTLTAAIILKMIPEHVSEVFLAGSTSKIGRAIALYLCAKGVRVLMLTHSKERFQTIKMEAPSNIQKYLVHVTNYQEGKACKTWILGKIVNRMEQSHAPSGTHFHQFVLPPIKEYQKDCTYGKLTSIQLPIEDVKGIGFCEYSLDRWVVHACHAGGIIHALEGWSHHEVGEVDVKSIDVVWKAALRHGFKLVHDNTK